MKTLTATVILALISITSTSNATADQYTGTYQDQALQLQYQIDDEQLLNKVFAIDQPALTDALTVTAALIYRLQEHSSPIRPLRNTNSAITTEALIAQPSGGVGLEISYAIKDSWSVYGNYRYQSSATHRTPTGIASEMIPASAQQALGYNTDASHNWSLGTELMLSRKQFLNIQYRGSAQPEAVHFPERHFMDSNLLITDFMQQPGLRLSLYVHNMFNLKKASEASLSHNQQQTRNGREFGISLQYKF